MKLIKDYLNSKINNIELRLDEINKRLFKL